MGLCSELASRFAKATVNIFSGISMKLFFLLCVLVVGCGSAEALQTASQLKQTFNSGQQVAVGVIGNSIACGYRANNWQNIELDTQGMSTVGNQNNTAVGGWVQQLQVWLKSKNSTSIVHNMAGSGWTTQDHLEHNTLSLMVAKTPKPVAVFIALQVNDRLKDEGTTSGGISWNQYLANTRTIIRTLIANDILPILVKENSEPMPGGAGWYWSDYARMGAIPSGNGTSRAYSEYVAAIDTISQDPEWVSLLGHAVDVIDGYSPTLNTGQVPQYRYQYENGTFDNSPNGLAPLDFRYDLMNGWIPGAVNDVWHPNQAGHDLVLSQVKSIFTDAASTIPPTTRTWQEVVAKVQTGAAVKIGILGNSIGCGQMANDSTGAVFNTTTMLDSSYANAITGGGTVSMLSSFGPHNPVEGWANQLFAYLQTKNPKSTVVNLSGSGWDSGDQLGVYSANSGKAPVRNNVAVFASMAVKPDAVLLPLQINDWGHGQGLAFYNANTDAIVSQLQAAGIVVVMVVESPVYNRPETNPTDGYTQDRSSYPNNYNFVLAARTFAAAHGLGLIDFFTPMNDLILANAGTYYGDKACSSGLFADGCPCTSGGNPCPVHPNQAGHNIMANAAIAFFQKTAGNALSGEAKATNSKKPAARNQASRNDAAPPKQLQMVQKRKPEETN